MFCCCCFFAFFLVFCFLFFHFFFFLQVRHQLHRSSINIFIVYVVVWQGCHPVSTEICPGYHINSTFEKIKDIWHSKTHKSIFSKLLFIFPSRNELVLKLKTVKTDGLHISVTHQNYYKDYRGRSYVATHLWRFVPYFHNLLIPHLAEYSYFMFPV